MRPPLCRGRCHQYAERAMPVCSPTQQCVPHRRAVRCGCIVSVSFALVVDEERTEGKLLFTVSLQELLRAPNFAQHDTIYIPGFTSPFEGNDSSLKVSRCKGDISRSHPDMKLIQAIFDIALALGATSAFPTALEAPRDPSYQVSCATVLYCVLYTTLS